MIRSGLSYLDLQVEFKWLYHTSWHGDRNLLKHHHEKLPNRLYACTLYISYKRKLRSIIHVIIVRIREKLVRSISFIRRVKFLAKQKWIVLRCNEKVNLRKQNNGGKWTIHIKRKMECRHILQTAFHKASKRGKPKIKALK